MVCNVGHVPEEEARQIQLLPVDWRSNLQLGEAASELVPSIDEITVEGVTLTLVLGLNLLLTLTLTLKGSKASEASSIEAFSMCCSPCRLHTHQFSRQQSPPN